MLRRLSARSPAFESAAALFACTVGAFLASARLLHPNVLSDDALVHQYWMWTWKDPALFTDALTADVRASARYPDGYEALFRIATELFQPIGFGEVLGIGLMAISGWLVFLITREHTDWRPAAWIAAALFLGLLDVHRFFGGFPRAFVHPFVLLTVLLAMKQRNLAAALVAAAGALFYPPAALLAVGVLLVSALGWSDRRPRLDRRRAAFAALSLALTVAAVLVPSLLEGGSPRVLTEAEARSFPEFNASGPLHFFVPSLREYLSQNRSGFDLRAAGSILLLAAVALLLARRGNLLRLRREVLALPVVAIGSFVVAHAVLFRLYLPHRYTYPLMAFLAIAVAVTLRPTWEALLERPRPRLGAFAMLCAPLAVSALAIYAFPLGPLESPSVIAPVLAAVTVAGAAVTLRLLGRVPAAQMAAAGAIVTGVTLLLAIVLLPDQPKRGSLCIKREADEYLATLPKDAVIAGDPIDLKCLPATARRAVVISTQLAPSYEKDYFLKGRERMFASLRAYYGQSTDAIVELGERYGATHFWLRRDELEREVAKPRGNRWHPRQRPYGRYVRGLLAQGRPASLDLPPSCRTWSGGSEVYDIGCIAAAEPTSSR